MNISKLKLILYWVLFIIGFYTFWLISYLLLARYALSEFSRFYDSRQGFWSQLKIDDAFWYFLFIAGIILVMYIIKQLIVKAPNSKIAACVYLVLLVGSEAILLSKLYPSLSKSIYILPHVIINGLFIVPMIMELFRKPAEQYEELPE